MKRLILTTIIAAALLAGLAQATEPELTPLYHSLIGSGSKLNYTWTGNSQYGYGSVEIVACINSAIRVRMEWEDSENIWYSYEFWLYQSEGRVETLYTPRIAWHPSCTLEVTGPESKYLGWVTFRQVFVPLAADNAYPYP